jgi:hypothetical protein
LTGVIAFDLWLPVAKIVLGIIEDLTSLVAVRVGGPSITGHHGSIVKEVKETTAVLGQNDLLLSTLNGRGKFGSVSLLELLARLFAREKINEGAHEGGDSRRQWLRKLTTLDS